MAQDYQPSINERLTIIEARLKQFEVNQGLSGQALERTHVMMMDLQKNLDLLTQNMMNIKEIATERNTEITDRLQRIWEKLDGNGRPGLVSLVNTQQSRIDIIEDMHKTMQRDEFWAKIAVGVFSALATFGAAYLAIWNSLHHLK